MLVFRSLLLFLPTWMSCTSAMLFISIECARCDKSVQTRKLCVLLTSAKVVIKHHCYCRSLCDWWLFECPCDDWTFLPGSLLLLEFHTGCGRSDGDALRWVTCSLHPNVEVITCNFASARELYSFSTFFYWSSDIRISLNVSCFLFSVYFFVHA